MWKIGTAITKRLWNRYELETLDKAHVTLSDQVVMVEDMQRVIQRYRAENYDVSVTGTGTVSYDPVPAQRLWHIDAISFEVISGTFTFGDVLLGRKDPVTSQFNNIAIDTVAAKTRFGYVFPYPMDFPHGSKFSITCDGFTGSGALRLFIHYKDEIFF